MPGVRGKEGPSCAGVRGLDVELLGVSPGTLYNHIPDLRELRADTVPRQLEAPAK